MRVKRVNKWLLAIVIIIIILGIIIWRLPLYYYHGIKTEYQLKSTEQHYTRTVHPFSSIHLDANLPVNIEKGNTNRIVVKAQKNKRVHIKQIGKKIILSADQDTRIRPFRFSSRKIMDQKITIYVKRGRQLHYLIRKNPNVTGDVQIKNLWIKKLELIAGSGNLNFDNFTSDHQLLINNKQGQINFNDVRATMLNLTTSSGTININNSLFTRRPSQIISDSSNVNLNLVKWNKLWLKTNEGHVYFKHQNSAHLFKVLTNDGDITGWIDYPKIALINSYSDNGNANVFNNLPTGSARYYSFYTDNGDINVKRGKLTFVN